MPGVIFIAGLLGYRFATRTLPGAVEHGGRVLGGAVVFYAAVISAMVVTAWATGIVLAAVGAMLFAVSDWVLGHRRFVGPLPGGRLRDHGAVPRRAGAPDRRPHDRVASPGCRASGCSGTDRW
ncbi:MAG: lysoplasmalogenase family protein [Ilumatobacteraceae bacterium]